MKRTKIQSVEEALKTIEESAILRGIATINGDSKTGNKYVPIQNKALVYLYEHHSLASLQPLLSHGDFNVRLYAAYALLPLFEEKCKGVLLKIANGDYGAQGDRNAVRSVCRYLENVDKVNSSRFLLSN